MTNASTAIVVYDLVGWVPPARRRRAESGLGGHEAYRGTTQFAGTEPPVLGGCWQRRPAPLCAVHQF